MSWLNIASLWRRKQPAAPAPAQLKVCEGVAGHFSYHLNREGEHKSLCGISVMRTGIPLTAWGTVTEHIKERWCEKCHSLADADGHTKRQEG